MIYSGKTLLRQKFWIFRGRSFVRKILNECVVCKKLHGKPYHYPPPPPLTSLRLNDFRAFINTGIDNFGPLFVKDLFSNDKTVHKSWVTLYTCAATRSIVLDLIPDMSSKTLIRSLKRFISRRGCPDNIISDNGKDYVYSDNYNHFFV